MDPYRASFRTACRRAAPGDLQHQQQPQHPPLRRMRSEPGFTDHSSSGGHRQLANWQLANCHNGQQIRAALMGVQRLQRCLDSIEAGVAKLAHDRREMSDSLARRGTELAVAAGELAATKRQAAQLGEAFDRLTGQLDDCAQKC
ncbi:hypothetical protein BOX15_Mlig028704g1 [Macrostomum lignano]|uniref:Uncharacterized protein n=1 Tax=Macrostomum lignano TaxID=282301 RepID=A0A267G9X5_9PLAT|nr:hypothetical protein BOX15_Mlig028704g1 [Macrostomum lignano]